MAADSTDKSNKGSKKNKNNKSSSRPIENVFRIMDEIVYQLNKTKRMFIWMIVSIIIAIPAVHIITYALVGPPFPYGGFPRDRFGGPPVGDFPGIAQIIVVIIVVAWIAVGIRQWFILSKWTKKYGQYKELQKKLDEKLDYDDDDDNDEDDGDNNANNNEGGVDGGGGSGRPTDVKS